MPASRAANPPVASKSWRGRINSHETFSHDSLDALGYDWERIGDPGIAPKPPFKVYLPGTAAEVGAAMREAKQLGQTLRIRSKGHSSNDLVLAEGGGVLLTHFLNRIRGVDTENLTADVEGGAITALVDDELAESGYGLPVVGDHRDISVGGFASVGGISPASHRFGLFIDNVRELDYVDFDGELHTCSPTTDADAFYRVLAGLGRHGVITRLRLRIIKVDKYSTIWENRQRVFRSRADFVAGTAPLIADPGDAMMERGVWIDFARERGRHFGIGQFSTYHDTSQDAARRALNTAAYGVLHGIGVAAGRLPASLDRVLKYVGMAGVVASPRYASIKNIEFFTDKTLDSTVGDPTRMLIALAPVDRYEPIFADLWDLMSGYRERSGCFTFIGVYVKSIRSPYLATGGQDRFCELMFYPGINPEKLPPPLLDEIVEAFDDIVIAHGGYRYMHSRTTRDAAKRAVLDPNLRHAARRAGLEP